ncbi:MAG: threonine-phosphate decarboxylase [Caldimonas sp.]|uniref:aminotransferase class I/II-fold pyridoxal phosphate-dependent enzyme n=1 Tax=Caldimonas taiwanensis TaxID=307483 RepID=UPI0007815590|nr:aminotransferase class I/II-fold pyridoxal phosphate-dependent enzyme [Caldimonas taiwanensis]GIX25296.1 MAG: threonine-phosphate decarboxylase [Caldimonas sp.]
MIPKPAPIPHGADLHRAIERFGFAPAGKPWLDLSTGINPWPWPAREHMTHLPEAAWHELPGPDAQVQAAFDAAYGSGALPVPGSQAAIQALPRLWRRHLGRAHVQVLWPSYGEHAARWGLEGHAVHLHAAAALGRTAADVIVIAHPNNPTGDTFDASRVRALAAACRLLVIDEAFLDAADGPSHAQLGLPNVVVLRSLGKFYGLAGLRVGAVLASPAWREALAAELGPWSVGGLALQLAAAALRDTAWRATMRQRLQVAAQSLGIVLARHGLAHQGTMLFRTVITARAAILHEALARQGVWTRLFDLPAPSGHHGSDFQALRLGLPPHEAALQRLDAALAATVPMLENP